jgi:uncharacterized RDD family membrane protein YckC
MVAGTIDTLPFLAVVLLTRRAHIRAQHRWDVALFALGAAYTIGFTIRFGQTLGQMMMGIRVVDANSRQPPRWTQVMVRSALSAFPYGYATLLPPSRSALRMEELKPEIQRLQHEHHDDPRRRDEELVALYRRRGISPFAGILRALLIEAVADAELFLTLRDADRRGLGDRAAKTLVIRSGPSTT